MSEELAARYDVQTSRWDDAHRWSPAPRFRRKIILRVLDGLRFDSLLEVGCAQPYLLAEIMRRFPGRRLAGVDIAGSVIEENARLFPAIEFRRLDIQADPIEGAYDVVVCSEVLEHLPDHRAALRNLRRSGLQHLIVTVPASPLFPIDRHVGHLRHFPGQAMEEALETEGFRVVGSWRWGFPFHTFYKLLINKTDPQAFIRGFSEGRYDRRKRVLSELVYRVFHLNFYRFGWQKIVLASA
jgi:trans-aconitate methyltransferase